MLLLFLFFFFKQKTAYEMRISDWSSDVCSSDLRRTSPAHRVADDPAHGVTGRDRPGAYKLFAFLKRDVGHLTGRGIDLIERAKLGRASCRERVCQYV